MQLVEKILEASSFEKRIAEGYVRSMRRANPELHWNLGRAGGNWYVVARINKGDVAKCYLQVH